jgi:hypothetical protein
MEEGEGGESGSKNVVPSEFVVAVSPTAAATTTAWSDAPAKKIVRQLDFNAMTEQSKPPQQLLQQTTVMVQKPVAGSPLPPPPPQPMIGLQHSSVRVG